MRLPDKVVLVTGGNAGIGRSIVDLAAAEGAKVVIAARNQEKGQAAAMAVAKAGGEAAFLQADLRKEGQAAALIEAIVRLHGRLDVVINNAGAGAEHSGTDARDTPADRWAKLLNANLTTAYLVSAFALPALQDTGGGAIVNISSTAALHGSYGIYGAAKAGVEGLTRALAVQGAPDGIRVNCVSPGWIKTGATQSAEDPNSQSAGRQTWEAESSLLGRIGDPQEVAEAVIFLASDQASFITGTVLVVDGGLTIVDPTAGPWLASMGANPFFIPDSRDFKLS